jgi:glutamate racemase
MYALSNDVQMAVVACNMAAAAILDFEQKAVTFEPFNRLSQNLMWIFRS